MSPRGFYEANDANAASLAASTTRAFLGINLDCAQCHNHPFARWSREQFWQTAAFFADFSRIDNATKLPVVTIPETEQTCQPTLLSDHATVTWPSTVTSNSLKELLVDWMVAEQQRYLAKNAVNRLWAHFFGQGIIEPMDDLSSDSAQDGDRAKLLDELAQIFIESGYDTQLLIKSIVRSDAYRMSSDTLNATSTSGSGRSLLAIHASVRAMTGEQLYDSLRTAAGLPAESSDWGRNDETISRSAFASRFYVERTHDAERSISQALTMMNGTMVNQLSTPTGNRVLASILESPFMNSDEQVDTVFVAVLGRRASAEELAAVKEHFATQPETPTDKRLGMFVLVAGE